MFDYIWAMELALGERRPTIHVRYYGSMASRNLRNNLLIRPECAGVHIRIESVLDCVSAVAQVVCQADVLLSN